MALSDADRASVRRFLGYPDVNRGDSALEGAMDSLSAEGDAIVGALLTSLGSLHTALSTEWTYLRVQRAEDVTLDSQGAVRALRAEGRRLVAELAAAFDVHPLRDIFSGAGGTGVARRGA